MNALISLARRCLALLVAGLVAAGAAAADYLDPAQAFQASLGQTGGGTVLQFQIAPHYHLYQDRLQLQDAAGRPVAIKPPEGKEVFDKALGQPMRVWANEVRIALPAPAAPADWRLTYQGCADEGLCYPPQHLTVRWQPGPQGLVAGLAAAPLDAAPATAAPAPSVLPDAAQAESDRIAGALGSGSLWTVAGVFLVFGLLLSFTPCVLPMLPILSSIIVGQSQPVSRGRGISLALSYSLGMALVYTAMGMLAGWLGQGLAAALQNAWVLGAFALLLAALSLSMFGVWEFQMPAAIRQRVEAGSNRLPGGKHAGVFAMGALSAVLLGPCVAAPLAGVLVYISQTRDLVLGGTALFAMACGMSVPLLVLGLSAGTLLPRTGAWMEKVKALFGVVLLATALWLVSPVLPAAVTMLVLGAGVLIGAGLLGWPPGRQPNALSRALALPLALWGVMLFAGAFSGGASLVQPLAHLVPRVSAAPAGTAATPAFARVRNEAELLQVVAQANGRPVLLDYYADWCVSCQEMEHLTFTDPAVQQRMKGALLVKADVTRDDAQSRALLKRYGLFGPPAVLFVDEQGRETDGKLRLVGFTPARDFEARLARAGL